MKIQKKDGTMERRILTAMVVDKAVCGRLATRWDPAGLFHSKWANLVAGWCAQFYQEYEEAPGASIEGIFEAWAGRTGDEDSVKLVEKFLLGLSGEYADAAVGINADYITDKAGEHFNRVRLERLATAIQGDIEIGRAEEAAQRVAGWNPIELGAGAGIDVLNDMDALREAFEMKSDPIIEYPGALGTFFGEDLERDAFVGIMGATGRGKTWWLIDVAWRAVMQQRRVAFFEVGDMSQAQIMRRFAIRAAKRPLRAGRVHYPTGIELDGNEAETTHTVRDFPEDLDWRVAWAAVQKMARRFGGNFKLSVHANSSINVAGIQAALTVWERQGWVPDVIVVDYADILAPPAGVADGRDQINVTWKQLRALSQSLHCLVVTATQSDAASYNASLMSRSNFTDDRRKMDHVTGMLGINMTEAEKEHGALRLNWLKRRDAEYTEHRVAHVAGCLAVGNPAVCSVLGF